MKIDKHLIEFPIMCVDHGRELKQVKLISICFQRHNAGTSYKNF